MMFTAQPVSHRHVLNLIITCITLGGNVASALDPVNPNLSAEGREVLDYLESIYGKHCLMGYNVYVHTPDLYEQTGRHGAVWSRDIQWLGDPHEVAEHALRYGYLLTLHWHWGLDDQSAWKSERSHPVDVGACVTPGTPEYRQILRELDDAAADLQVLEDAGVPVLWRPLHEIDGGWFWWTDTARPENSAALWRLLYDYLTHTKGLDNLIWVYNAATGEGKSIAYRSRFYPGADTVDIATIDIYGADFQKGITTYHNYFDTMTQVAPGKMLGLGECVAVPDPDKMAEGTSPKWLYALPWYGPPMNGHSAAWALHETRNDFMITLDELPFLGQGNLQPHIGLLQPEDNGAGRFGASPTIAFYAGDRGGSIAKVDFYADGTHIGTVNTAPWQFTWNDAPPGSYSITAVAEDNTGTQTNSNTVHISTGVADLAYGQPMRASSGSGVEAVVDGDIYTGFNADRKDATPDDEWVMVDLGDTFTIDQVHSHWGWKIHPEEYTIDVCTGDPTVERNWTTVKRVSGLSWITWKAVFRDSFPLVPARYVRLHLTDRIGNQNWGGYSLTQLEVPVALDTFGDNDVPVIVSPATASPTEIWEYSTDLNIRATDADREYLTYTWSVASGPVDDVVFEPNGNIFAADTQARFVTPGPYTLRCTVSDLRGAAVTSEVNVEIFQVLGSLLTDDRSKQSGNGLGEFDTLSKYNDFALRFLLQRGKVASATLRVFRKASNKIPIVATARKATTDDWNETDGPMPDRGDLLDTTDVRTGGVWMEFDVTDYVTAEAQGDGIASFIIINDQGSWNTQVHTKQNSVNPPELVVTFSP